MRSASRLRSIVPASPRTAGPVKRGSAPRRSHVVQARALQREHRGERVGHAGATEQILGDRAGHDEVVRGEDGGGVIQRALRVVQSEGPRPQVIGDPLADRVALGVVGGDRHRGAGDQVEGRAHVGERLQGMDRERPRTGRSRGREDVQPRGPRQVRDPLTGTEALGGAICSTICGIASSGTPSSTSSAARAASAGSRNGTPDRNRDARSRVGPRPETATIRCPARPRRTAIAVPTRPAPTTEMFIAASMPTQGIHRWGRWARERRAAARCGPDRPRSRRTVPPSSDDRRVGQRDRAEGIPETGPTYVGVSRPSPRRCPGDRSLARSPDYRRPSAYAAVRRPREHPRHRELERTAAVRQGLTLARPWK